MGFCAIFTQVSDLARVSFTPFGEGYTEQGPCLCFQEYGALPFSPINWTKCKSYSMGWWKIYGSSTKCFPVVAKLKDPHLFPHKKQYPLKPEVKEGLKPIENLKEQGLLLPCNSPWNTPIFGIKKSNGKWRLVQDLWIINEAVVPLHPIVPNTYTLLSEIPERAKYFSVIDLKDAFYSVPSVEKVNFYLSLRTWGSQLLS